MVGERSGPLAGTFRRARLGATHVGMPDGSLATMDLPILMLHQTAERRPQAPFEQPDFEAKRQNFASNSAA